MKPAAFSYVRPRSRDEVDALLERHGEEAKLLAGGQSLIPMLNMRLTSPSLLVDLGTLEDEPARPYCDDGHLIVEPLVRQLAVEHADATRRAPLVRRGLRLVAHQAIRSRGTVVGSVAHADPAAEMPAVLLALDGSATARSARGRRRLAATELLTGPLETSLDPIEWLEDVRFPVHDDRRTAITEYARRHGDYALCGAIAVLAGQDPTLTLSLTLFAIGSLPLRIELAALTDPDVRAGDRVAQAVRDRLAAEEVADDLHAGADFRRHLAVTLGVRAARAALDDDASANPGHDARHAR